MWQITYIMESPGSRQAVGVSYMYVRWEMAG